MNPQTTARTASATEPFRYAAFISYRHVDPDRRWAKWLHAALETYRVPRKLVAERGVPRRVRRVFRDEEELPASADLNSQIETALRLSRFLIVICSPRATESEWVNKEVQRFREMGRHDRILALLIEGEPAEAFPRALREIRRTVVDSQGLCKEEIEEVEPLAADVRQTRHESQGQLKRLSRLRILACILGLRFDDLRQREQERRTQRLAYLGGLLAVLVLIMGGLAFAAVRQSNIAGIERQNALTQKQLAENNETKALRQLADLYVREGLVRLDSGDPSLALLWFIKAMETDPYDPIRSTHARIRLATTLQIAPRLLDRPLPSNLLELGIMNGRRLDVVNDQERKTFEVRIVDVVRNKSVTSVLPHTAYIHFAKFSPDGNKIITAGQKGYRLWDAATGRALTPFWEHKGMRPFAAFSPDGSKIITPEGDKSAQVRDTATGQTRASSLEHKGSVNWAAFSPNGSRVVTASDDKTARVWDTQTGMAITTPLKHEWHLNHAAFSPDGSKVVTAGNDRTARVWDASTGKSLFEPLRHDNLVHSAAFSPDGSLLLTTSSDTGTVPATAPLVRIWDARTGQPFAVFHADHGTFSHQGNKVVTTGNDHVARIWDARTGQPLTPPLKHEGPTWYGTFSPDDGHVVTAMKDHTLRFWDARSGQPPGPILEHNRWLKHATFSPDGNQIATASGDHTARVWDAVSGRPLAPPLEHADEVLWIAYSSDGTKIVTACKDGTARVWDSQTGAPRTPALQHATSVKSAVFSPDGSKVLTASLDRTAGLWDANSGRLLAPPLQHPNCLEHAEFSPDGAKMVAVCNDGTARLWDVGSLQALAALDHPGLQRALFSPDGSAILTAGEDDTARIWSTGSGQLLVPALKHDGPVYGVAFSPDGSKIVTASGDRTARVWESATGQPLTPSMKHEDTVFFATFSPDGSLVATASKDRTARVWDARSGQPVSPAFRHKEWLNCVLFSPDGNRIVTASGDKTARVWDVGPDERPLGELKKLAELLACQRIDESDGLRGLTAREWKSREDELHHQNPTRFHAAK